MDFDVSNPVNYGSQLNQGLVAWYLAAPNMPRGLTWRDMCGVNDGTLTNGPIWVGGGVRPGGWGALSLDGSNDGVNCGGLTISTGFLTLSLWMNPSSTSRGDLVTKWNNGVATGDQYNLLYGNTGVKPQLYVSSGASTGTSGVGSAVLSQGTWYFITAVYDGTVAYVYLNGLLQASSTIGLTMNSVTGQTLWVGRNAVSDGYYSGKLDDVRIYNRALSAAEVFALYDASQTGYQNELNWIGG